MEKKDYGPSVKFAAIWRDAARRKEDQAGNKDPYNFLNGRVEMQVKMIKGDNGWTLWGCDYKGEPQLQLSQMVPQTTTELSGVIDCSFITFPNTKKQEGDRKPSHDIKLQAKQAPQQYQKTPQQPEGVPSHMQEEDVPF